MQVLAGMGKAQSWERIQHEVQNNPEHFSLTPRLAKSTLTLIPLLGTHEVIFAFVMDEHARGTLRFIKLFTELSFTSFQVTRGWGHLLGQPQSEGGETPACTCIAQMEEVGGLQPEGVTRAQSCMVEQSHQVSGHLQGC